MDAADQIATFLERSGWTTMRLAQESGLHLSMVSKLLRRERPVTIETALRLEVATKTAKRKGEMRTSALLASALLTPDLAELLARRALPGRKAA